MSNLPESFVFLATPTSGTGSLWRIISALATPKYQLVKIAEEYAVSGKIEQLPSWKPEKTGFGYMYNTPHVVAPALKDSDVRLIVNFRDPRDMACNQYHWIFQHPDASRTPEQLEARRREIRARGMDSFVLAADNTVHYRAFIDVEERLKSGSSNVLILSYNQLCLGFDHLVERLRQFFEVDAADVPWDKIEAERTTNLEKNPQWIGQMWTGADTSPGRYLSELHDATIKQVDEQYQDTLRFIRRYELPEYRRYLTTAADRNEESKVLAGKEGYLFLKNDGNNVLDQIMGKKRLPEFQLEMISDLHLERLAICLDKLGCVYKHMIVPDKEVVLREYLPEEIVFEQSGPRPYRQYAEQDKSGMWKPYYSPECLLPSAGNYFFTPTDTHWNHAGAIKYLKDFLRGELPEYYALFDAIPLRKIYSTQQGDLGSKIYADPDRIEIIAPVKATAEQVFHNGINNEGSVRYFRNRNNRSLRKAFVMHDSTTLWLMGVLPELFSEVLFFHGTIFDTSFLKRYKPDLVLCIQVERFFSRLPTNENSMLEFIDAEETEKCAARRFSDFVPEVVNESGR